MTISQIRDNVDAMATSGQLTTRQQMALITAGLQDLNAGDKSYQPAEVGLTRETTGSFDASAIMQQRSEFDLAHNDTAMAKLNQSLVDLFQSKETTNSFGVSS